MESWLFSPTGKVFMFWFADDTAGLAGSNENMTKVLEGTDDTLATGYNMKI